MLKFLGFLKAPLLSLIGTRLGKGKNENQFKSNAF